MDNNQLTNLYLTALNGLVDVDVIYGGPEEIIIKGALVNPLLTTESYLQGLLAALPGQAEIILLQAKIVIKVRPPGVVSGRKIPWLNIGLFVLTLFSTIIVGASINHSEAYSLILKSPLLVIRWGIPFSFSLLAILLCHEFGHYFMSRKHGVKVTLPYFIPFPNFIGTMGAVIRSKSPFITRNQLLDVGAAGPLSGMIVAIPILIWGLAHPQFIPIQPTHDMMTLGDSLLFSFINGLVAPSTPSGFMPVLHPVAFAGWVGFLVTMLNLMPIGQLDGGHIVYALFGKIQHKIAYVFLFIILGLSIIWYGWLVWIVLGFLIKPAHPPTVLDDMPLDRRRKIIGYICIVVFILCFIPAPISIG
jgi:membrane-associated protease RseP (regulator of RpoE activity)